MMKKTTHLIFVFFCINTISIASTVPANQPDVVDEILNMYMNGNHIPFYFRDTTDALLKEKNLSVEQLYKMLQQKKNLMSTTATTINNTILSFSKHGYSGGSHPGTGGAIILGAIAYMGSIITGATFLKLGSMVNRSAGSSTTQKIFGGTLNAFGITSLIPAIVFEWTGEGIILSALSDIYRATIPSYVSEKINKMNASTELMHHLESSYPELLTNAQPTSP